MGTMERILRLMAEKRASDVYLSAHAPARRTSPRTAIRHPCMSCVCATGVSRDDADGGTIAEESGGESL